MTECIPVDQDNQCQASEEEVEQPIAKRLKRGLGVAFYAEADWFNNISSHNLVLVSLVHARMIVC
jgi:hypothetical protein